MRAVIETIIISDVGLCGVIVVPLAKRRPWRSTLQVLLCSLEGMLVLFALRTCILDSVNTFLEFKKQITQSLVSLGGHLALVLKFLCHCTVCSIISISLP